MVMWYEVYSCNYNKNNQCKKENNCKYNCFKGDCNKTTQWEYARRTPLNYIKHHIKQYKENKYDITKIIDKVDITNVTEDNILLFQVKVHSSEEDIKMLTERLERMTKCKCILLPCGVELSANIEIKHKEAEE